MLTRKHAFPDGRCSRITMSAGESLPAEVSSSYSLCRLRASSVVKNSPAYSHTNSPRPRASEACSPHPFCR
uniref:Uncharacterized protein n=1 Tax=Arundo donax TaxID=35708 RepID=A0A0A9C758_ARUDO